MTTALLAFWTCGAGGHSPGIDALRAVRTQQATHRRHIVANKHHALASGELLGMGHTGHLGLAGKLAAPSHHIQIAVASSAATRLFEPLITGESKLVPKLLEPLTLGESKHAPVKKAAVAVAPEMQLCSVNVSDEEIQKFLPLLTVKTGLNIILMSTSPAKVTMHVEKMRFIDVMRHVCALTGFAYLKASDAYILAPAEALKAAYPDEWKEAHPAPPEPKPKQAEPTPEVVPILTQTFTANYIKAGQLVEAIKKLVPTGLDIIAGPGQDTPSLANVDPSAKTGQSSISVTQDTSTGPTSRTIILRGSKANIATALDIAKQLDVPRSQVSIGVTIHDISDDAVKDLGLSWNFSDLTLSETPSANGIGIGKITRSPMTFDAAIKALETRDVAHLMASPNVSLLDGEKAFILIGDRINYPVLTGYTSTNSPIFSVNTERVGIYLQVAASISSDGYVTLTLYPQVSSITGYLNVNGASYPQVSSREAQTTLRVKSGDTIVLGGMLQDQDIQNVDKVPILSSIPFFGELFKHRTKTKSKSQVIITIRPSIVPQAPK